MTTGSRQTLRRIYQQELQAGRFRDDPAQLAVIARLDDLRNRLMAATRAEASFPRKLLRIAAGSAREPVRGIYLWGSVGRGKTWLMDRFFQSLPFPERRRSHFHRFMHGVHGELARLKRRTSPLDVVAERIASKVRVLCLDELFVSDIADAMILAGLFASLTQRGVSLVVTSNTPPAELYKNGLQRQKFLPAIKVLERHTEVFAVDGGIDHRLRQLTQAGTYLDSALPLTAQRLAALFSALADGAGTSGGGIQIGRRAIPVLQRSESVVWFDFAAICEGPRGTDDYIEIARQYQCVVISDVPVLDERADDAARRFIALVDEFYDRGVDLVISAAAPPQGLYRGERLKLEFQRATSRLIEMQSEEYLAREHRP